MLGPGDPLACRPSRVLVAGTSGAGKTTTAARIAGILGIPHVEIDALFHGSDWTPRPSFASDVRTFSAGPAWVTEWQYRAVRAHLADRADLLVWLDLSRSLVMRQVIRRTLVRRLRRQELWNGNLEPALSTILTDREHIVRWAWNTHHKTHARVAHLMRQRPDLYVVRLRNRKEVNRWLSGPLRASVTPPRS
jgi:adenylate kinase family enzyme